MRSRKKAPLFFDLDETLIYATEPSEALEKLPFHKETVFDYTVFLRPEAHELLASARDGGRDVYLFTGINRTTDHHEAHDRECKHREDDEPLDVKV